MLPRNGGYFFDTNIQLLLTGSRERNADSAARYFAHYARELVYRTGTTLVERGLTRAELAQQVRSRGGDSL